MYMIIKHFSHDRGGGFHIGIARAMLTWARHPVMQRKWVRILPHVNDTLLLLAALTLSIMIGQYPFVHGWLSVKLLALGLYIGLGVIVIKQRGPAWFQGLAFVLGVVTFFYIEWVAITHWPWPWQR